jgi:hypothetical protein
MPAETELEGLIVTDSYLRIFEALKDKAPIVFVSGKAGSGKSTLIRWIIEQKKWRSAIVAPTGIAALNVGGATIHSFFKLPSRLLQASDIRRMSKRALYENLDLLIIDEISMVRADVMDAIGSFLEKNGPQLGQPFGGVQILLVGDLFQLPPVVSGSDLNSFFSEIYPNPYFFSSRVLGEVRMKFFELEEAFRQKDRFFAGLLNQIRTGENLEEVVFQINQRCFKKREMPQLPSILLTTTNRAADIRNEQALASLSGENKVYAGTFKGAFDSLRERLPSPEFLKLKIGAQVMLTKNGSEWVNGSLGVVRDLKENSVVVEIQDENPRMVEVEASTWESVRYHWDPEQKIIHKESAGQFSQIPLTLAWATTIHKAQGKTLSSVEIDLGYGAFAAGQAYVALSRCRELSHICLSRPLQKRDIICEPEIARFYSQLKRLGAS